MLIPSCCCSSSSSSSSSSVFWSMICMATWMMWEERLFASLYNFQEGRQLQFLKCMSFFRYTRNSTPPRSDGSSLQPRQRTWTTLLDTWHYYFVTTTNRNHATSSAASINRHHFDGAIQFLLVSARRCLSGNPSSRFVVLVPLVVGMTSLQTWQQRTGKDEVNNLK